MRRKMLIYNFILFLFIAGSLQASWMGETWLWVKINKADVYTEGSTKRKITFTVIKWAKGAGHGDDYGNDFPGKSFTEDIVFIDKKDAESIKPGQTTWVMNSASTGFTHDSNTGEERGRSSNTWSYLGNSMPEFLQKYSTVEFTKEIPQSEKISLIWHIEQDGIVSLRIKYRTGGLYYPEFRLHHVRDMDKEKSVTMFLTCKMTYDNTYHPNKESGEEFLQYDLSEFTGKTVVIKSGKRELIKLHLNSFNN